MNRAIALLLCFCTPRKSIFHIGRDRGGEFTTKPITANFTDIDIISNGQKFEQFESLKKLKEIVSSAVY